jgi:hypothetical protein
VQDANSSFKAFVINFFLLLQERSTMKYCNILTVFALVILTMYNHIIQGIKAGGAVAEFLKEGDFGKTLQSIATNLSPFLGVLGPLASLAFSFIHATEDSAELIFMSTLDSRAFDSDNKLKCREGSGSTGRF